jgi:hypothetical protein
MSLPDDNLGKREIDESVNWFSEYSQNLETLKSCESFYDTLGLSYLYVPQAGPSSKFPKFPSTSQIKVLHTIEQHIKSRSSSQLLLLVTGEGEQLQI